MKFIYIGAILGYLCIYITVTEGHPQFYYAVPAPAQQAPAATYYSTSFGPNLPFPFTAPSTAYFSQPYNAPQAYYTTHQTFGSLGDNQYQTFTEQTSNEIGSGIQQTFEQPSTDTVYSSGASDQYRGFAYHTQTNNGASTNVYFVTGPEAHHLGGLQSLLRIGNQNETNDEKARTLASNITDANATDKNEQQQINETLAGTSRGSTFDTIRSFLENPQIGFQNLYSTNLNLPANTVLLPAPISIQAFGNFGLASRFNEAANETNSRSTTIDKPEKSEDKEEQPAESMIEGVTVKTDSTENSTSNETENNITSTSTTTEIVTSTTTAPSSTTEAEKTHQDSDSSTTESPK